MLYLIIFGHLGNYKMKSQYKMLKPMCRQFSSYQCWNEPESYKWRLSKSLDPGNQVYASGKSQLLKGFGGSPFWWVTLYSQISGLLTCPRLSIDYVSIILSHRLPPFRLLQNFGDWPRSLLLPSPAVNPCPGVFIDYVSMTLLLSNTLQ